MAGPWSYDLAPLVAVEAAVSQALALSDAVTGELYITAEEGAVAQALALTTSASGEAVSTYGPWSYDLEPMSAALDGSATQAMTLTQDVDLWETIATGVAATTYDDAVTDASGPLRGYTYEYRVTDSCGNVLYSNTAMVELYVESAITQSFALTQAVANDTVQVQGAVSQAFTLATVTAGGPVVGTSTEGAVSQLISLSDAVQGFRTPEYGLAEQSMALASSVTGIIAVLDGSAAQSFALTAAVSGVKAEGIAIISRAVAQDFVLTDDVDGVSAQVTDAVEQAFTLTQGVQGTNADESIRVGRLKGSHRNDRRLSHSTTTRRSLTGSFID